MFKLKNNLQMITIDTQYMETLYNSCNEVFYLPHSYDNKPYIGILINDGNNEYAIPLTSAKEKHKIWKNINNGKILIYENINIKKLSSNDIYTLNTDGTAKHILSALIICKMVPIKSDVYNTININYSEYDDIETQKYKTLLNKEFSFCVSNKDKILKEANRIYQRQLKTKKIYTGYCDFLKLEDICKKY